jgi:uncharacterized membrane protein
MQVNGYGLYFVLWNIFLALLPCWAVFFLANYKPLQKNRLLFALIFLFWLAMLPNTAYLFFMVRHLVDYCTHYDQFRVCQTGSWVAFFFFAYALIGLPTFYYALSKMTKLVKRKWLPLPIIPLTSVGLLFGLYERFNSWDLITHPLQLIETAATFFTTPTLRTDFIAFTLTLFLIYYATDFFWNFKR